MVGRLCCLELYKAIAIEGSWRRKDWREICLKKRRKKKETENKTGNIYAFKYGVHCLLAAVWSHALKVRWVWRKNWNRKYSSSENSKSRASQVKHCGLIIANMWHLNIKASLIIILAVLYKQRRVCVRGKHARTYARKHRYIYTHARTHTAF